MALTTYDQFIDRIADGYGGVELFDGEVPTATTATLLSGLNGGQNVAGMRTLPTLPSGVTAYIPTAVSISATTLTSYLVAKVISLGSIDISGASGTFTDGSSMPTITELGTSRTTCSAVIAEVTTALNATPGSLSITYVDQDGNSAEATTAQTLTASAAAGTTGYVILNAGDIGVQDITTAVRSAGTTPTGVIKFWGVVPIVSISTGNVDIPEKANLLTQFFNPIRLGAGDVIRVFPVLTATTKRVFGMINFIGED
jgi:hypothetical protein